MGTIILLALIGVFFFYMILVENDRETIQRKQAQIERDLESLKASIKEEEAKRKKEYLKHVGEA